MLNLCKLARQCRNNSIIEVMEEKMQRILVIEDDAHIRELIIWNLSEEGYSCTFAKNGRDGVEAVRRESPGLILLDVMLPSMNGFEVLKTLRMDGIKTPVIMLTAKNEETDKVLGLEFGADDYITKPFSMRELKARIKAVFRRYTAEETRPDDVIKIEDIVIDIPRHEVMANGKGIVLTLKEFELLQMLAQNRSRVLTREQLLDQVWGYEYPGETRTVDVHIRYLRRKLGEAGDQITTVRGLGYKLL